MLYSTKRLQNTEQYKEFIKLKDSYYKLSLTKEQGQQKFFKKMSLKNETTGENFKLNSSFEKDYKKYTKSVEQKVYTIEKIPKLDSYREDIKKELDELISLSQKILKTEWNKVKDLK